MNVLKPFILKDYDLKKPFSSFLPGVAGKMGIPIWTYYANRGQGVTSFGVKDKNGAILEFNPACISYEKVVTNGFRTFLKINGQVFEPFGERKDAKLKREFALTGSSFSLLETNHTLGYRMEVTYFGLPQAPLGALARVVTLTNLKEEDQEIELLDGITHLLPRGITNGAYKDVGNLMRSWMEVKYLETRVPFFSMRSSSGDEAEIHEVKDGNFYLAKNKDNELLIPIVDSNLIFLHDESKRTPHGFIHHSLEELYGFPQYPVNKVPCAFVGCKKRLKQQETMIIQSLIGMVHRYEYLENYLPTIQESDFFTKKKAEMDQLIVELVSDVDTHSAVADFDEYLKQSYLDNLLRGGYPVNLGTKDHPVPYYLYSRKHGDPERDYNWFNLEPEYYSQGNGNFRDINQNRRNDSMFHDFLGTTNIKRFMNLIQMDGYNPLGINGSVFYLREGIPLETVLSSILNEPNSRLQDLIKGSFSPGALAQVLSESSLKVPLDNALQEILSVSEEREDATFGEGYWIDHFTYNLDLIETYLKRYPERKKELFLSDPSYRFYQSPIRILPRTEKIGLTSKNTVRQYGSISHWSRDEAKCMDPNHSNWHKTKDGAIYQTTLLAKLVSLVTIKFASLDPLGYGVMMEANKPGWNDAMNGLPGLLGSGIAETIELYRIIRFLQEELIGYQKEELKLYEELGDFICQIEQELTKLEENGSQIEYWNQVVTFLESYRAKTNQTISGKEICYPFEDIAKILTKMQNYLHQKLQKLLDEFEIIPTYLTYTVTKYQAMEGSTPYGLKKVTPLEFEMRPLPPFLEAPARFLKIAKDFPNYELKERYQKIKQSDIYDKNLFMYKTSGDLEAESFEIGRIRAFSKGWLERESNFMHMNFKYLYGLLLAGLYEEFFEDIKTNFPPFFDPLRYGRSIYENCSFIATSNNPDPETHGQGFVARLSGSNTEIISMWLLMMFGILPFEVEDNQLRLTLKPLLPNSFFKDGKLEVKFLGSINVIYHNLSGLPTYDSRVTVQSYELLNGKMKKKVTAPVLTGHDAEDVRDLKYTHIIVTLDNKF